MLPLNEFRVHSDSGSVPRRRSTGRAFFGVDKTFAAFQRRERRDPQQPVWRAEGERRHRRQLYLQTDQRPTVAKQQPDIRVNVFLQRDMASVALDLSGEGLHQRGYRDLTGQAPLKENRGRHCAAFRLAAGHADARSDVRLRTLLIEAAMIAADRARACTASTGASAPGTATTPNWA
ncbi:hypothetical protein M8494_16040 [Serratia ureilytica]